MTTTAVCFPFDLFGGGGTGAGATLLSEALREVLADNRRERAATRAAAYTGRVTRRDVSFENLDDYRDWRGRGRRAVRRAWRDGDFLLWFAGNHLGVLPVYDELSARGDTLVVQLDAHLDVQHFSDHSREPSHGNFLLHCDGPLPPVVNVGHRDLLLTAEHVGAHFRAVWPADRLASDPEGVLGQLRAAARGAGRVFLDLDCDVFDPAFFPAVPEPVPFGLGPGQVLRVLDAVWSDRVAGLAVSEFDPGRDVNDRCLAALVWLTEYVLLKRYEPAAAPAHEKTSRKRSPSREV